MSQAPSAGLVRVRGPGAASRDALRRSAWPLLLAASALLAAAAPSTRAQGAVWVVDAAGGPGSHFFGIDPAVQAAASGDVIVVRDGGYGAFTVAGKALHIVAEAGHAPVVNGTALVKDLSGSQHVVLRGLTLNPPVPNMSLIDLRTSIGPVWIEDCTGVGGAAFQCSATAWIRNTFDTGQAVSGLRSFQSKVSVWQGVVNAGNGADGFVDPKLGVPLPGQIGTHGLRADGDDDVFVSGSSFAGGDGGVGAEPRDTTDCTNGGAGASGLALFASTPVVRHQASTFLAGAGGAGGTGCAAGAPGVPVKQFVPGGTIDAVPGSSRSVAAGSPVREGGTLSITFDGEADDTALLLYAFGQQHVWVGNLEGVLLLKDFVVFPVPFALGPTGSFTLDVTVPDLGPLQALPVYLGGLFIDDEGDKSLGSGTAALLLDDAF